MVFISFFFALVRMQCFLCGMERGIATRALFVTNKKKKKLTLSVPSFARRVVDPVNKDRLAVGAEDLQLDPVQQCQI